MEKSPALPLGSVADWAMFAASLAAFGVALRSLSVIAEQSRLARIALRVARTSADAARASASAAQVGAQVARQELELAHRPWIVVSYAIESGVAFGPNGNGSIQLTISMENTGRTPARNVRCRLEWYVPENGGKQPFEFYEELKADLDFGSLPHVIAPGDKFLHGWGSEISGDELRREFDRSNGGAHGASLPTAVVCVGYQFTFSEEIHYSGLIFHISRRTKSGRFLLIEPGVDTPRDEVIVYPGWAIVPT